MLEMVAERLSSIDKKWAGRERSVASRLRDSLIKECIQMTKPRSLEYYWSELFRKFKNLPDGAERIERLCQLSDDFVTYATQYAKTIVLELSAPHDVRTLDSVRIGGVAGGAKYVVWYVYCLSFSLCDSSILFKFPQDTQLRDGRFLYGDKVRRDDLAIKAAGLELRGANHYSKYLPEDVYSTPMQCIIDFQGFRVVNDVLLLSLTMYSGVNAYSSNWKEDNSLWI